MSDFDRVISCFIDTSNGPLKPGCRKTCLNTVVFLAGKIYLWTAGVRIIQKEVDADYSYYLGPDYKRGYSDIAKTSTIVSNHVSWLDAQIIFMCFDSCFTCDSVFKNVPIMGHIAKAQDFLFLPRGGNEEKRNESIKII